MIGRQLTKAERESWRVRLERAMPPHDMIRLVEDLRGILGGHMLVQAGLAFVRDAWTAGRFAQARGAHGVRLWPGDRPDCELTFHDKRELFEIVEADQPGRRRSSEYRDLIRRSELGERPSAELDEDWHVRAANAPRMLEHAAASKKAKGYDAGISLLIHLNLMEYGFARQEIEAAMHRRTACAKNAFQEVWVLWQGRAYPVWKGGEVAPPDAWPRHEDDDENDLISGDELWRSVTGEE